ncbi:uncharacterized protein LOC124898036 [Capsicum annuum]|uniref:uncharacterized protein LOC124898036 n=1 Tax=Capsicum annuum TaxID=4072 RepID=UPI001FB148FA|nr:uncharacterized protein LOC124898036 [Capsicum annuum]
MMITNIAELLKLVLKDEQEYPVSERHAFVNGTNNKFVPYVEKILRDNKSASDSLYVTNANRGLDQFTVFSDGVTAKVNLLERSCTCREFNLVKILCEHAMAALRAKYSDGKGYGNFIYEYASLIYKVENYPIAYSEAINVVLSKVEWTVP